MKAKVVVAGLIGVCLALSLSACGKRGGPFPPKDEPNTYPRKYPKAEEN